VPLTKAADREDAPWAEHGLIANHVTFVD